MPLNREERKLLHQKSKQPTFGTGKPDSREGHEGDISFRKVEGSGTVEYVKENNDWVAVASSGEMPAVRIVGGSGGSSTSNGVTSHGDLSGRSSDDHEQYLLIDGSRAMTGDLNVNGGDISIADNVHNGIGKTLTISAGDTTAGTTNNIAGGSLTFEGGKGKGSGAGGDIIFKTANASGSGSSLNALATSLTISDDLSATFAGNVSVGDDLLFTSSGSIINWNSGDVTLTHAAGKLTFGGDDAVELDFNNHEMTNVDINSGAIDGTTVGASSQAAGDFTAIGAVSAGTIVGTTIDATTDFTIGGTVITDATITDDGNFTIAATGDIVIDATGNEIYFKDNTALSHTFNTETGSIKMINNGLLDNSVAGRLFITDFGNGVHIGDTTPFNASGGMGHGDETLTYDHFVLRWDTEHSGSYIGQHIAGGESDYKNNYAMIGFSATSAKYANHATDFALV